MKGYNGPYINFFRAGDPSSLFSGLFFVRSAARGWPRMGAGPRVPSVPGRSYGGQLPTRLLPRLIRPTDSKWWE